MANLPQKILIIDSDAGIASPISSPLEKMKVETFLASDLQTAMYRYNKQFFRVVIIEVNFQELDALALIQKFREHEVLEKRSAGFILLANTPPDKEQMALIKEMGDLLMMNKPLKMGPLVTQISKANQIHSKLELARKIKIEIYEKLEAGGDLAEIISSVNDYKIPLGRDYFPLIIDLYQRSGNFEQALDILNQIPEGTMEPLTKLNLEGSVHLKLGNFSEAKKALELADKQAPRNMDRIQEMVHLYLKANDCDKAVLKQKQLMEMSPENPDLKFEMFQQLEEAGFEQEAAAFCQETSAPQEVVKFFNNKGVVLVKTNSIKEALLEYRRALTYYPKNKNNYLIHYNIALAYMRARQIKLFPKAMKHLDLCLKINPEYQKGHELKGRLQSMIEKHAS